MSARSVGLALVLALTVSACANGDTAPPPAAAAPSAAAAAPPVRTAAKTPEQVKGECWMKFENDRHAKDLDTRLKLVDKCVEDTLRAQGPQ